MFVMIIHQTISSATIKVNTLKQIKANVKALHTNIEISLMKLYSYQTVFLGTG